MPTRALIIAVERYEDPSLAPIPGAVAGARKIADWVLARDPKAVVLFCGPKDTPNCTHGNTADQVIKAIASLIDQGRDDTTDLFVYFTGHGMEYPATFDRPVPDVLLLTADFTSGSALSGESCLRASELQNQLRFFLGGINHYYFIDACRVPADPSELEPRALKLKAKPAITGQPAVFTLYAALPGAPAANDTKFADALIEGLNGVGRAKTFVRDAYYVLFDSLRDYVATTLKKDHRRIDGTPVPAVNRDDPREARIGRLAQLPPNSVEPCTCHVEIEGAAPDAELLLAAVAPARATERRKILGSKADVKLPPDRYKFELNQLKPELVSFDQKEPDARDWVYLYQDGALQFEPASRGFESFLTDGEQKAIMRLRVPPWSSAKVTSARDAEPVVLTEGDHTEQLDPGEYEVSLLQHGEIVNRRTVQLDPGGIHLLDAFLDSLTPAQKALFQALSHNPRALEISESLGPLADPDPSVWLALVGASGIIAPPGFYTKLQHLSRASFDTLGAGEFAVYVLVSASARPAIELLAGDAWQETTSPPEPLAGVPGVFHASYVSRAPVRAVGIGVPGCARLRVVTASFPGRVTLVVCVAPDDGKGSMVLRQLVIPPLHLLDAVPERARVLEGHQSLLHAVRFLAQAQARFASRAPLATEGDGLDRQMYQSFADLHRIDPVLSVLIGYEILRRGDLEKEKAQLEALVGALRELYPDHPDTEALATMAGLPARSVTHPPLILDGLVLLEAAADQPTLEAGLVGDGARLDFEAMWTTARGPLLPRPT